MSYRFGDKLRTVRERRGLTLKEVARRAGLSESLISQIERNKVSPAIDTLLNLVDALDIDLEYVFADFRKERSVQVVRAPERRISTRPGARYERLARIGDKADGGEPYGIEAYLLTVEPKGETGHAEYGHPGHELGIIVEGRAELAIGSKVYELDAGDSVSFAAELPHSLRNSGSGLMRAYWVVTPPKPDVESY